MDNQITLFDRDSEYLEASVKDFNENNATFRVHASLIYKLGESLIADEVTALSELIKNAYDADATICSLSIDSNYVDSIDGKRYRGYIELFDNGCGMDLNTIVNGWLTLSNSSKKKMKKDKKTTAKYHRYPLGDKGLGRLSVQKLGRYMKLITKSESSNYEYSLVIPWGDFLKNTTIDKIFVSVDKKEVDSNYTYTKIKIYDLINPDLWGQKEQINLLTNSINKIVSPFRSRENNFRIVAKINEQPIDTENKVFDELLLSARAKHTVSYSSGAASIVSVCNNSFFYNRDILSKVVAREFTLNETAIKDFLKVNDEKLADLSVSVNSGGQLVVKDSCNFSYVSVPLNSNDVHYDDIKGRKMFDPGSFELEIYEYSLDNKLLDYLYNDISFTKLIQRDEYKEFIARFHGIKVVRDGFVIQGFGDGDGGDWLGLSSSSKTTGRYFDLRNDSVIGCVYLTGENNFMLKETTNREGFIEDEYFRNFKSLLVDAIKRINRNRNKLNSLMKQYVVKSVALVGGTNDDVLNYNTVIKQIKDDYEKVEVTLNNFQINKNGIYKELQAVKSLVADAPLVSVEVVDKMDRVEERVRGLVDEYEVLVNERNIVKRKLDAIVLDFEKMGERVRDLLELAGLGLSVEMFAHEFYASVMNIRQKNQKIIEQKDVLTTDGFVRHINYVSYLLDALRKQMSYFNPGLKYVRAEKQIFSIKDFLNTQKMFYTERCNNKNIEFNIVIKEDFDLRINRGMLNQVFDNLFSNSEYWLDYSVQRGIINKKHYNINVPERGIIIVWDNGIGISTDIEKTLFDPFETKKMGGRGLGLYIASGNLKYSSSRIRVLNERNQFGNLFKFEIDVSQVIE